MNVHNQLILEREETMENKLELASNSLETYLGSYTKIPNPKILQQSQILNESLEALNADPEDQEFFGLIIDMAKKYRIEAEESAQEAKQFCYDVFIACVIRALPTELQVKFEQECRRDEPNLPNIL